MFLDDCSKSERGKEVGGPKEDGRPRQASRSRVFLWSVLTSSSRQDKDARSSDSRERLDPVWRGGEDGDLGEFKCFGGELWGADIGDDERRPA